MLIAGLALIDSDPKVARIYDDRIEYILDGRREQIAWRDEGPLSLADWSDCGTMLSVSNGRISVVIDLSRVNAVKTTKGMTFLRKNGRDIVTHPEEVTTTRNGKEATVTLRGGWRNGQYVWGTSAFGLAVLQCDSGDWKTVAWAETGDEFPGQTFSQEINGRLIFGCGPVVELGTTLFEYQPSSAAIKGISFPASRQHPREKSFAWTWVWSSGKKLYLDGAAYDEWQYSRPLRWRIDVPKSPLLPITLQAVPIDPSLPHQSELLAEVQGT